MTPPVIGTRLYRLGTGAPVTVITSDDSGVTVEYTEGVMRGNAAHYHVDEIGDFLGTEQFRRNSR